MSDNDKDGRTERRLANERSIAVAALRLIAKGEEPTPTAIEAACGVSYRTVYRSMSRHGCTNIREFLARTFPPDGIVTVDAVEEWACVDVDGTSIRAWLVDRTETVRV